MKLLQAFRNYHENPHRLCVEKRTYPGLQPLRGITRSARYKDAAEQLFRSKL